MRTFLSTVAAILLTLLLLSACSSEDPQPKVNCEQLEKEADKAKEIWRNFERTRPAPNTSPAYMEEWTAQSLELKHKFLEASKAHNRCTQ